MDQWAINIWGKESQQDKDDGFKQTKYKAC